jgi:hypothetical protein
VLGDIALRRPYLLDDFLNADPVNPQRTQNFQAQGMGDGLEAMGGPPYVGVVRDYFAVHSVYVPFFIMHPLIMQPFTVSACLSDATERQKTRKMTG